jgi:hypothetical protein
MYFGTDLRVITGSSEIDDSYVNSLNVSAFLWISEPKRVQDSFFLKPQLNEVCYELGKQAGGGTVTALQTSENGCRCKTRN